MSLPDLKSLGQGWGYSSVVEHLSSVHKALAGFNPQHCTHSKKSWRISHKFGAKSILLISAIKASLPESFLASQLPPSPNCSSTQPCFLPLSLNSLFSWSGMAFSLLPSLPHQFPSRKQYGLGIEPQDSSIRLPALNLDFHLHHSISSPTEYSVL